MSYAMQRDSRRDRGQWRGCHTFQNIICDGDAPAHAPREGGLKMGHTYYYYYEVNGTVETHDPAVPHTTTCPYLPGQRVNTLWVPVQHTSVSRQRSASVNAVRRFDFQTMEPADKFLTPRPPPATPSVSATPKHLLRHQRSACSLSPAPAPALSTWSPRRLFARRTSPGREKTRAMRTAAEHEEEDDCTNSNNSNNSTLPRPAPPRLASSSSASSASSFSRLRQVSLAPPAYCPSASSQGSRSRDISPESLRRFLVDDVPLDGARSDDASLTGSIARSAAGSSAHTTSQHMSSLRAESDDEDADSIHNQAASERSHDMDFIDDDEHNFATSTTSETAPMTILSPPPALSRNITPIRVQADLAPIPGAAEPREAQQHFALPAAPTRAPPTIPLSAVEPVDTVDDASSAGLDLAQRGLSLKVPSTTAPPSPMSLSPLSLSSAPEASEEDEAEREPLALFLPPSGHPYRGESESSKAASQQQHQTHRHHLMAAALTGSTATLVPGNGLDSPSIGSGLDELVDELGWMATAIQG